MAVLSESQYRQYSGDIQTPWETGGTELGAQDCVDIAALMIGDHLSTFLEATEVEAELHRLSVDRVVRMGTIVRLLQRVYLNRLRLLTLDDGASYADPAVTLVHQDSCDCSETTQTGCALVLFKKESILNVSGCVSSASCTCFELYPTWVAVKVTYWAGFTSLDKTLTMQAAKVARKIARDRTVFGSMNIDLPEGAPMTSKSVLDVRRAWAAPARETFLGANYLGVEVERALMPYKIYRGRAFL